MLRRVLVLPVFGLVVAGAAVATWHARSQALLVQADLVTARELLARAGGFQAEAHAAAAGARLGRFPLRQLGILPWSAGTSGSPGR